MNGDSEDTREDDSTFQPLGKVALDVLKKASRRGNGASGNQVARRNQQLAEDADVSLAFDERTELEIREPDIGELEVPRPVKQQTDVILAAGRAPKNRNRRNRIDVAAIEIVIESFESTPARKPPDASD